MNNILGIFITACLAFMVGGWHIEDKAKKYVDDNCNTVHIIETHNGHFYECKPINKQVNKQVNKE